MSADPSEQALDRLLPATVDHPRPPEAAGTVIAGKYKLLERIGEGGMGEVWAADQFDPVRRRVAVKLIKPGMDTKTVLARFEQERQALALMDHPNIAKVLDGGLTADGRPFFVMELVKGVPITEFCDTRKLSPRDRLTLFVLVCQAVQHAHQKGIIHRDLKPSNVLVALHDEKPVPKVIDFGVAKAIAQPLTERTLYTAFGALVGTPAYMAPEQATFNQLDVDTRADVYALGVILYELLAGSPPFEPERLKRAGLDEVLRLVREEEPPRPSARLSTSQARASIAATRQTDPNRLARMLRGELDWVVMKALEKDRDRRYASAGALEADIGRYLADEPVLARPPSLGYRARKWARRNAVLSAAAAVVILILIAATVGTGLAFRRARQAAVEARDAEALARQHLADVQAQKARADRATDEAREWEGVFHDQAFLSRSLTGLPPDRRNVPVRELVDRAAADLAARPERDHRRATLHHFQLTALYKELGDLPAAFRHYAAAFDRYRAWRGEDHPETWGFGAFVIQGAIAVADRHPADESPMHLADRLLLDWLAALRRMGSPPTGDAVASVQAQRGYVLLRLGRQSEAEPLLREALPYVEPGFGAEIMLPGPQRVSYWLGRAILARGDHAAAEPYFLGWVKELQTRAGERAASDLREALPRVTALYESWGKPAEAAMWRATWAALPPPVEHGPMPRVAD